MSRSPTFPATDLHGWYVQAKRDLPWRRDPKPYKVWISEIMLQQTQVGNVIAYFLNFLRKFPSVSNLADAPESEVLSAWSGLGYYSRGRNLKKAAQVMMSEHSGKVPETFKELIKLPGIGPYTAGAIASIAFEQPLPILDGNVKRVLSRFYLETDEKKLWSAAESVVRSWHQRKGKPSEINQALMELGALICSPRAPKCSQCPLRKRCGAKDNSAAEFYPVGDRKLTTSKQSHALLLLERQCAAGQEFLLEQRSGSEPWLKGMWQFPIIPLAPKENFKLARCRGNVAKRFSSKLGQRIQVKRYLGKINHQITRYKLDLQVIRAELIGRQASLSSVYRWVPELELQQFAYSSILKKTLALAKN